MTATIPDDVTMPTNFETWERDNIRRHVATAAMNGLLAQSAFVGISQTERCANYAKLAVQQADALLAELAK